MAQAIEAGNAYQLSGPSGFNYFPPAATTPLEVLEWAAALWKLGSAQLRARVAGVYAVERIIGGQIGARMVEHVASYQFDGKTFAEVL